ncbi:MAG: glycerate kinase [Rubellimicrobium sp.]|nr:glycerate kinase [Rubellimicrobium sp.]
MAQDDRDFLAGLFRAAVDAADPVRILPAHLPARPAGRTVVIGAGKGVAGLARAVDARWDGPLSGVVVTRHGQRGGDAGRIRVLEAAHPVPDRAGEAAVAAIMAALSGLGPEDLVLALVTGGGSALLPAPGPGLSFGDEVALNRVLLDSGAPISVMNAIRKQVSRVKGGRLALAAHPARVVTLVVSDVPGDDPAQVASGPTVPDTTTRAAARALAQAWRIDLPSAVAAALARDDNPAPLPGDPRLAGHEVRVIASARLSLEAAMRAAGAQGIAAHLLSDAIEGEARDVGRVHAAIAREVVLRDRPFARPALILSGGETTVTLARQGGRGGRNTEFLLAFALAAGGLPLVALAADTDGIDGTGTNAGAFADGDTLARIRAAGLDPVALLGAHDAWGAFDAAGDLFVTGPTGTNVNDFRAILIR